MLATWPLHLLLSATPGLHPAANCGEHDRATIWQRTPPPPRAVDGLPQTPPATAATAANPASATTVSSLIACGCRSGRYGRFGGKYVPETLIVALQELEDAYDAARKDPAFQVASAT